ncbi:hypothetical protein FRX31_007201 [Thalictrum thalictroides]|uniref:Uncharacterized protein n=1 Tax=Thalictrum thalictroides TaxID=46969 RepID=A0A7J6X1J6_THATH|nr:hypothetical protein FRX31_007201 [Thalictrum thalictroides]
MSSSAIAKKMVEQINNTTITVVVDVVNIEAITSSSAISTSRGGGGNFGNHQVGTSKENIKEGLLKCNTPAEISLWNKSMVIPLAKEAGMTSSMSEERQLKLFTELHTSKDKEPITIIVGSEQQRESNGVGSAELQRVNSVDHVD